MLIWEVSYEYKFFTSMGMERYEDTQSARGFVITQGNSLDDVRKTLQASLPVNGSEVNILWAQYMGKSINSVLEK